MPDFKRKALAAQKLKRKEHCKNEHRETANLCRTLRTKPKQLSNFDGILNQLRK